MGTAVPWGSSSEELPAVGVLVRSAHVWGWSSISCPEVPLQPVVHTWARSSVSCPALRCPSSPSLAAVFCGRPGSSVLRASAARTLPPLSCMSTFLSPASVNRSEAWSDGAGVSWVGGPRWTSRGRWCPLVSAVSSPDALSLCGTFTGAAGGLASSSAPPFPCWRPVLGEAFLHQLPDCLGASWRKSEVVLVSFYSPDFRVKSVPLTRASGSAQPWTLHRWGLAPRAAPLGALCPCLASDLVHVGSWPAAMASHLGASSRSFSTHFLPGLCVSASPKAPVGSVVPLLVGWPQGDTGPQGTALDPVPTACRAAAPRARFLSRF